MSSPFSRLSFRYRDGAQATSTAPILSTVKLCKNDPARQSPNSRLNPTSQWAQDTNQKGMAMTEQEDRRAREREEIATRIANFKATQEKFEREREQYFAATLANAQSGSRRPPFWTREAGFLIATLGSAGTV
jgi:hypothetical protein